MSLLVSQQVGPIAAFRDQIRMNCRDQTSWSNRASVDFQRSSLVDRYSQNDASPHFRAFYTSRVAVYRSANSCLLYTSDAADE